MKIRENPEVKKLIDTSFKLGYNQAQEDKDKEILKILKSELKFLESKEIEDLVGWADINCSHEDYQPIEKRKIKLKEIIKQLEKK